MTSAIVVLGKGISEDGTITKEAERSIEKAVELFKSSRFNIIVMSGRWAYSLDYTPSKTEAHAMKEYAVKLGIPAKKVFVEDKSLDTLGNAYYTKKLLENMGNVTSITVVTVDFHNARARYIFEKIFGSKTKLNFISSNTDYLDTETTKKHRQHEEITLAVIKRLLDNTPAGDDAKIQHVFDNTHPLYAKDPKTVPEDVWKDFEAAGKSRDWIIERYSRKKNKR